MVDKPSLVSEETLGWREAGLNSLCDEITVGYVGPMSSEYREDGVPFLRSQNVENHRLDLSDVKYISPDFHARLKKSQLGPRDVVIVRTGKPGACAIIPDSLKVANCADLVIVRCGRDLDPRFLTYYINSAAQNYVDAHLVGAVQQHFNVGAARDLILRLPPLDEQQEIASVLGALDDKIDLVRRVSATLEAVARALFSSWFVDFDPVQAKAEGREAGLTPDVAALFPDSFIETSGLRVPLGWSVRPIGDLADIVGGSTPSTSELSYWDGTNAWATPKDLASLSTPVLLSTQRYITNSGLARIGSGLLPVGTVLLSSRAPIGYLAIAGIPVAINQGFIAMRPRAGVSNLFLLRWASTSHDAIVSRANGSTFLEISKTNFRPIPVIVPPTDLMRSYDRLSRPLFERVVSAEREARTLSALRDALLPKLISGQLRLHGAKTILEKSA